MLDNIREISTETFYHMEKYSQLIIDLVEEVEDLLNEETFTRDDIGSLQYRIENVNQIINPNLEDDIEIIQGLLVVLATEYKKFEN